MGGGVETEAKLYFLYKSNKGLSYGTETILLGVISPSVILKLAHCM